MLFYILFLGAFLFATLTSSISMIEINVANTIKGNENKRGKMAYIFGFFVFLAGAPSALSYGVLGDIILFGRSIFDNVDFLVSNINAAARRIDFNGVCRIYNGSPHYHGTA